MTGTDRHLGFFWWARYWASVAGGIWITYKLLCWVIEPIRPYLQDIPW